MLFQFFAQPFSENYYKLTRVVSNILDRVYLVVSFTFIQIFWSKFCLLYKVPAFAWYSVKIRVIFGVRFEGRKVYKKANLHENWNMHTILESFEYLWQISSILIVIILSYIFWNLVHFWDSVVRNGTEIHSWILRANNVVFTILCQNCNCLQRTHVFLKHVRFLFVTRWLK